MTLNKPLLAAATSVALAVTIGTTVGQFRDEQQLFILG